MNDRSASAGFVAARWPCLRRIGIDSLQQVREEGVVQVFARAVREQAKVNLGLLWALEAALTQMQPDAVSAERKAQLLLALRQLVRR